MDIWGLSWRHGHFTPGNETPVPIEQEAGGAKAGADVSENIKSVAPAESRTSGGPARSLPTTPLRLAYCNHVLTNIAVQIT
jgi:hypothetical protein